MPAKPPSKAKAKERRKCRRTKTRRVFLICGLFHLAILLRAMFSLSLFSSGGITHSLPTYYVHTCFLFLLLLLLRHEGLCQLLAPHSSSSPRSRLKTYPNPSAPPPPPPPSLPPSLPPTASHRTSRPPASPPPSPSNSTQNSIPPRHTSPPHSHTPSPP